MAIDVSKTLRKFVNVLILATVMMMLPQSTGETQSDINVFDKCTSGNPIPFIHYPMSQDYFNEIMTSEEQFVWFDFAYYIMPSRSAQTLPKQKFQLTVDINFENRQYVNQWYSDFDTLKASYLDFSTFAIYAYQMPVSNVDQIFQIINNNSDYYFNGSEYGGQDSLVFESPSEIGFDNSIMFSVKMANPPLFSLPDSRTFVKGWQIGEDPPAELLPLINHLENVVIPEMRNHPKE